MFVIAGCTGDNPTPPEQLPQAAARPIELTEVRISPLRVETPFRFDTELAGLLTMALELDLADLPGVIPRLPGQASAPWVLTGGAVARRQVDATFTARGKADALTLSLELCVAGGRCEVTEAPATREAPWAAMGLLMDGAADLLGVEVSDATREAWSKPGSRDPYAELVTGRGCATYYGTMDPPEIPGDRRKDPVARAVYIDPKQPIAWWARARWELASTSDGGQAIGALTRATLERPGSPALAADLATAYALTGRPDQAVLAWEELVKRTPGDPRFAVPYARALLAVGRAKEARTVLAGLPSEFAFDARVAALRVRVVEADEGTAGLDPLLEHWQRTDARAVEPVRRRIDLRVQQGRWEEALALIPALRTRAPGPQTDALEAALYVAVGRPDEAAARVPAEVADRLRARALRAADPGAVVDWLPAEDVEAMLARAESALWRGQPVEALAAADAAAAASPARAEAQVARAKALEALGRGAEAADAWQRAWELDPGRDGGPVAPDRVASTFRYVVLAPSEAPGPADEAKAMGPEL